MIKKNFNNSVLRKIKGNDGETLTETLVSVLIIVLSLTMLAVSISSARSIVLSSRDKMSAYYAANENVVLQSGSGTTGTVNVTDGIFSDNSISVFYYTNKTLSETNPVVSYRK